MLVAESDIRNLALADQGLARIDWARAEMPVLQEITKRFERQRPLEGVRISGCLHITAETANLARALKAGGADLVLCASNPLSTQDDVAAALVRHIGVPTFAIRGEDGETYYRHIDMTLAHDPAVTLDDGADLVTGMHERRREQLENVIGGTEETTTGVIRLRAMANAKALAFPIIAVNDAMTKHLFDNRYGTGQSALDGIIRATNLLIAGKTFTVVGYGWCGRGLARRAAGHGAHVVVAEVEPVCALEAAMDGYRVMRLEEAAALSDFIVTVTGNKHVVDRAHFEVMKDGCVLANAGHFDVEIDVPALRAMSIATESPRAGVEECRLADGRRLRLLCEGRLVNLAAAEGHPAAVMDMSFANQALSVAHLVEHGRELDNCVHAVPSELDREVARLKLATMNIAVDELTGDQLAYLSSWREGT
jgi:adenosylhomocysteinase